MKLLLRASFIACSLFLFSTLAFGQGTSGNGSVTGRVTDPSGANIPGATIDLVDKATNLKTSAESNVAGLYIIQNVPPGSYDLVITKSGFRKSVIASQQVLTGQQLTVNVAMEVGATTETVEVTAVTGAELQTDNATMGTTLSNTAVMQLPTLDHDVGSLVFLQPTAAPTFHNAEGNTTSGNVGGAMADQNTYMLDGGNNTSDLDGDNGTYIGARNGVVPTPIESVEEFRVNTNNMTADFSQSGGAQIMVQTKRGTSQFHGSAYDFNQNSYFASNSFNNNFIDQSKPKANYNKFGGAIGGPISKVNVLGGGWYFFANYEGEKFPRSGPYEKTVPSNTLREGIITIRDATGNPIQYNLNNSTQCGEAGGQPCDPRGIGLNPVVNQIWSKEMPQCNSMAYGDHGLNTCGFVGQLNYPLSNNFGVVRMDHDFGSKWRFFSSYRYFSQSNPTTNQVDVGGVYGTDTLGQPATASTTVYNPRYLVGGITGTVTPTLTNQFHFSYTRNDWNWIRAGAVDEVSGIPAGVEIGGDSSGAFNPINMDSQNARNRTWDGHDYDYRDDISWLKGTHLFQFGGDAYHQWLHFDRYDNVVGGLVQPKEIISTSGLVFPTANLPVACTSTLTTNCVPAGSLSTWEGYYADILGIVGQDNVVATRTGSTLALNPLGTPVHSYVNDNSYSLYFSDTWKIKPNLTLTYGLNWTLQMPPSDLNGTQMTLVDAENQLINTQSYLNARLAAAENGQIYNPTLGYSPVGVAGPGSKYPYQPFYGGLQPRVAIAWSPDVKDGWLNKLLGDKATVIRGGYGRSYVRNLGINLVSTPVLGPGFLQSVTCQSPDMAGNCTGTGIQTPSTAYRIGVDGTTTPFPAIPQTLSTPVEPGVNASYANLAAGLDSAYKPGYTDSIDISIQRQLKGGYILEASYVGSFSRKLFQGIDINDVPWMLKLNGQTFANAFDNLYLAQAAGKTAAVQPFFEKALGGSSYCNGFSSCTAAVASNEAGNIGGDYVTNMWSDLESSWVFGPALPSTAQCEICYMDTSTGKNNYNALTLTVQKRAAKGLTMSGNFTYGRSLGTISLNQSYTENNVNNPWNLNYDYGPQFYDRKFTFNVLATYQLPIGEGHRFATGQRFVDRAIGGWNVSPILSIASGLPLDVYTGSFQELGNGYDGNGCNAIPLTTMSYSSSPTFNYASNGNVGVNGDQSNGGYGINLFGSNAPAVYNNFRPFLVGMDTSCGGGGQLRGQWRWNLDLGLAKDTRITDRVGFSIYAQAFNVFNHTMFSDPYLAINDPGDFGALEGQYNALGIGGGAANYTRVFQFGLRLYF